MSQPEVSPAVDQIPTERLDGLAEEIVAFPSITSVRGRSYAAGGRVQSIEVNAERLDARVRGTRTYHVTWTWSQEGWAQHCTCPVSVLCKHTFAVAWVVLSRANQTLGYEHPRLRHLFPRRHRGTDTDRRISSARANGFEPPPTARQAPGPRATTGLDRLLSSRDFWERQRALERIVSTHRKEALALYAPPFPAILREPDAEMMCWLLARAIPEETEGWLPPEFEPFLQRKDLEKLHSERLHSQLAEELLAWTRRRRPMPERSLRVVLQLEGGGAAGAVVNLEPRVTGPRLDDEPRNTLQLNQLRSAARKHPGLLSPEQTALLDALVGSGHAGSYGGGPPRSGVPALRRILERFSDGACLMWDREIPADLAARSGVVPGAPVVFSSDSVRLVPICPLDLGPRVELGFVWPDGHERRFSEALHFRASGYGMESEPSLVLADGVFAVVVQEPPEELVHLFEEAGGLAVPRERIDEVMAPLAASFPSFGLALASRTRRHRVRPVVGLDLRDSDWLQIRVFAPTVDLSWRPGAPVPRQGAVFEYTTQPRWERLESGNADRKPAHVPTMAEIQSGEAAAALAAEDAAPREDGPPPEECWLEAPAPEDVAGVLDWLERAGAGPGTKRGPGGVALSALDREVGWWTRLNPRTITQLAEAWDDRPKDCAWFGTEQIRRLFSGEHHIRPRVRVESSGIDWLSVSADWEAEGFELSDEDLAKLRASTGRFVRLPGGWVRRDSVALHDETAELLADLGIEAGGGAQRLGIWQLAQARPESLAALEEFGVDPKSVRAISALRERVATFQELPRVELPSGLMGELRPYQRQGLDFLDYASSLGLGVVLADDMGLGKTVQALAWLLLRREREPKAGPTLVVCPASVMHNWVREAERFAPSLSVLLMERGANRKLLRREIPNHHLVVTNYALLRRDLEDWKAIEFDTVILDEAQNVKNPDAGVSRAVLQLTTQHRLALTGTPLENRALDLWSIMSFVNPGYLGNRATFTSRYDRADAPPHARRLLAAKLRPVMLRRLKKDVAPDLPDRIEERRDCELTRGQRQLYLAELARSRALVDRLDEETDGVRRHKIEILAALTRLRQICCHPALVGGRLTLGSGKFEALFELLEPLLAEGHKVLLFSQFVECLKLLGEEMRQREIPQHLLTGQTVHRDRVVQAFVDDPRPCVFAISLKAGGTGLNLTAASYVVLFDPWWNPAVEAQAIDRTHRIGQERTVIAYRMLARGTIEEKIWELQQRKAALIRDVLGEDGFARTLSREDLEFLLADV